MEEMLFCVNSHCRFLLDLSGASQEIAHSRLVVDGCPECGHEWSSRCPSCSERLSVAFRGHHAHGAACGNALAPQKSRSQSRAA